MKSRLEPENSVKLIKAEKTGWQRHLVRKMIHYKVRTGFHSCLGQGMINLRKAYEASPETGVLAIANHSVALIWPMHQIAIS